MHLNGQIEETISCLIMPAMTFIGNLVYVGIAVVGGLQVASGAMQLGDVQAFIQYSRQFTQPLAQLGSMANLLQSGVASAERVFELLDTDEQSPDPSPSEALDGGRGRLVFENVSFSYSPDKPLISDLSLGGGARADGGDCRADGCGQDHAGEPDDAVLRAGCRADNARRRGRHHHDPQRAALADGHGAAGHVAVRRDHPGQHRVRPAWRPLLPPMWTGSCTHCPRVMTLCWRMRVPMCPRVRNSC